jgi:hypothetical protein
MALGPLVGDDATVVVGGELGHVIGRPRDIHATTCGTRSGRWVGGLVVVVVQRKATRSACQRSRVLGDTSRSRRSWVGSGLLRAAEDGAVGPAQHGAGIASAQDGDLVPEHRISTSLAASDRASSASQLSTGRAPRASKIHREQSCCAGGEH